MIPQLLDLIPLGAKQTVPPVQSGIESFYILSLGTINPNRLNDKLAALRDWLLPMLMNGQVKIEDKILEKV